MRALTTSFYDWQQRFAAEQACLDAIAAQRWPEGFRCPHCGHDHGWPYAARHRYECARCYRQTSITSVTVFNGSGAPLTKWFWTLYFVSADKGGLSALRLSKIIDFAQRRLQPDAFPSPSGLAVQATYIPRITPPEEADHWLPWVHIVIANLKRLKRFLLGTFHGAVRPHRLQEYIDEFVYGFNRRSWEEQIPNRLLALCVGSTGPALCGTGAKYRPVFSLSVARPFSSSTPCRIPKNNRKVEGGPDRLHRWQR